MARAGEGHYSLFYLSSTETAEQVAKTVLAKMDSDDRAIVVDATHNDGYLFTWARRGPGFLKTRW